MKQTKREQVESLWNQGVNVGQIARETGLTMDCVEYLIERQWLRWASQYGYDN